MSIENSRNPMDAGTVILSAIVISAIGALFYNLLPMYLGTAQDSKGLTNAEIGFISTAFFFGYNAATLWAFYWIRKWNWRWVTLVATPIAALGLYASTLTDNYYALLFATAISARWPAKPWSPLLQLARYWWYCR
jgi:predicted MFS family arabinose efflux permease